MAALATLALSIWIWGNLTDTQPAHERGQIVFRTIAGLALGFSLFAGIGITADCLSEEKREGTLGLLFLTDLKGYDVVLGKLAATSLNALYCLVSVFPLLAIPLLLGALTLGEFWRIVLVLTNTLFFSLAAGILASSVSWQERRAMLGSALIILAVTAGPALIGLGVALQDRAIPYNLGWLLSSAVYPAVLALDQFYRVQPEQFWSSSAVTHLLGWGFLALASIMVRRTWQDRPAAGQAARVPERCRSWRFGHGPGRNAYRRRLLEVNPVLWLAGRDRLGPVYVWAVLAVLGLTWLWLFWKYRGAILDPAFCLLTAYCVHTIIKLWVASEASRPLAEDRRSGALELILSTPLPVSEIVDGVVLALKRMFAWPVAIILCADVAMLLAGASDGLLEPSQSWLVFCVGLMVMFVADLYTLAWVGLWLSLNVKKVSRAVNGAISRVLVLPWAIFIAGIFGLAATPWRSFEPGELELISGAFALALLLDSAFFGWAAFNLRENFRAAAAERFEGKPPAQLPPSEPAPGAAVTAQTAS